MLICFYLDLLLDLHSFVFLVVSMVFKILKLYGNLSLEALINL